MAEPMKRYSRALSDIPDISPLACSVTRGISWAYVLGTGDKPDVVLLRHRGCPMCLTVPDSLGWPRSKGEALAVGLRVLQYGYLSPRPLAGVSIYPRYDARALHLDITPESE